jgi:hypothetical protein
MITPRPLPATGRSKSPAAPRPSGRRPAQLAFELNAYLLLANALFVASPESTAIDQARLALKRRLSAAATKAVQPAESAAR